MQTSMKLYTHDGSGIFSIEQTKPEPLVKKESMAVKSTMHTHVGKSGRFTCTCKEPYKTLQATKHMHADDSGLFRCDTCSTAKADPEMIAPKAEKTKAEKTKGEQAKSQNAVVAPSNPKKKCSPAKRRKTVLILALTIIALTMLFPPWIHVFHTNRQHVERPAPYSFIFDPPPPRLKDYETTKIDLMRLSLQTIAILALAGIGLVTGKRDEESPNRQLTKGRSRF